jgi:hypothetical protein
LARTGKQGDGMTVVDRQREWKGCSLVELSAKYHNKEKYVNGANTQVTKYDYPHISLVIPVVYCSTH